MYEPLNQKTEADFDEATMPWTGPQCTKKHRSVIIILSISLIAALTFNLGLLVRLHRLEGITSKSAYVGLQQNVPTPIPHDTRSIDDPYWDNTPELNHYAGFVALGDEFVRDKQLPTSMRWPWDSSKRIYVLHAYHSMHCVQVLRMHIRELTAGNETTWSQEHATHCLHVLKEDIMCNADDTPRYAGALHAQSHIAPQSGLIASGTGQVKMCKDWNQLHAFATQHSACYKRDLHQNEPLLDRYKHCPDGSRPWENMDKH